MPLYGHNANLSPFDHCTSMPSSTTVQSQNPTAFVQICHTVWHICTKAVGSRNCTVTMRLRVLYKQDTHTHHTVTVQLCHPAPTSYDTCSTMLSCVKCIHPLYIHAVTTIQLLCKRVTTSTPYGHCTNMPLYSTVRLATSLIYNN